MRLVASNEREYHEKRRILQNGESSKVEFKTEEVHIYSLAGEIIAFANLDGGAIFIGIDDSGEIKRCERKNFEEFVVNVCRNNVRPAILPVIEKVVVDGKLVLVVIIERGDTPYSTNRGLYFIRVGSTKQPPTQQELLRLFQKRNILQFGSCISRGGAQGGDRQRRLPPGLHDHRIRYPPVFI